jgi:hypothetical protein
MFSAKKGTIRHMKSDGICEMCGHHVGIRQKAYIIAEGEKTEDNVLMLCPTCHIMFDTHIKSKIFKVMIEGGFQNMPESWKKSIYDQAKAASAEGIERWTIQGLPSEK